MDIIELLIITILSIFQSIFGIGLLVFGTPAFLLMGYDFFDVLNILLPFSITISLLQVISNQDNDFSFSKKMIIYAIPSLVISLIFLLSYEKSINFIVITSFTIVFFSLVNLSKYKNKIYNKNYTIKINSSLVLLGIIHGLTNLGGSLLTLISTNISHKKELARFNIAAGYLILGVVQLVFINIFHKTLVFYNLYNLFIPILCFFFTQHFYNKIQNFLFSKILNITILIYGSYILLNSII